MSAKFTYTEAIDGEYNGGSEYDQLRLQTMEQEISQLKLTLKNKENQWNKERAILEQKIQLYELHISDAKVREENLKKMNETFMQTLNDIANEPKNSSSKVARELQNTLEMHTQEIMQEKTKFTEQVKNLEQKNKILGEQLHEKDLKIKELEYKLDKDFYSLENKIKDITKEKECIEIELKKIQDEKRNMKELNEYETKLKQNEYRSQLDRIKQDHQQELERVRQQSDIQLKQIKLIYESDRDNRLERSKDIQEAKQEKLTLEETREQQEKEIVKLNGLIDQIKKNFNEELCILKKQKEEIEKNADEIEQNYKKLKSKEKSSKTLNEQTIKSFKEKIEKQNKELQQYQEYQEENKKLKQINKAYKEQIVKLEESERKLKNLMIEQEYQLEEEKLTNTRKDSLIRSIQEKSLSQHLTSQVNQCDITNEADENNLTKWDIKHFQSVLRSNYDSDNNDQHACLTHNDFTFEQNSNLVQQRLNSLPSEGHQFSTNKKKVQAGQIIHKSGQKMQGHALFDDCSSNPVENCKKIQKISQQQEYQMSNNSQGEGNNAMSSGKKNIPILCQACSKCLSNYQISNRKIDGVAQELFQSREQNDFNQTLEGQNSIITKIVEENYQERLVLEDKIGTLDQLCKQLSSENIVLQQEKEKLEKSLQDTIAELERVKIDKKVSDQKKDESEQALKNEIKYLVDKLMQAKEKIQQQSTMKSMTKSINVSQILNQSGMHQSTTLATNHNSYNNQSNFNQVSCSQNGPLSNNNQLGLSQQQQLSQPNQSTGFMNFIQQNKENSSFQSKNQHDIVNDKAFVNLSIAALQKSEEKQKQFNKSREFEKTAGQLRSRTPFSQRQSLPKPTFNESLFLRQDDKTFAD